MDLSPEELKEVMAVFKEESAEQMATMLSRMTEIGTNPGSATALEELHRVSHSLKGSARMLGLEPIEKICAELEHGFKNVIDGKIELGAPAVSAINDSLKDVQLLIDKLAADGTTDGFDVSASLQKLEVLK